MKDPEANIIGHKKAKVVFQ